MVISQTSPSYHGELEISLEENSTSKSETTKTIDSTNSIPESEISKKPDEKCDFLEILKQANEKNEALAEENSHQPSVQNKIIIKTESTPSNPTASSDLIKLLQNSNSNVTSILLTPNGSIQSSSVQPPVLPDTPTASTNLVPTQLPKPEIIRTKSSPDQPHQTVYPTSTPEQLKSIDKEYATLLSSQLDKLRRNAMFCDVEIYAEQPKFQVNKVFYSHRVILATSSQRFCQILSKASKKPSDNSICQIFLPSKVVATGLDKLLEYIYTGKTTLTDDSVAHVCIAANYFDIKSLVKFCLDYERTLMHGDSTLLNTINEMNSAGYELSPNSYIPNQSKSAYQSANAHNSSASGNTLNASLENSNKQTNTNTIILGGINSQTNLISTPTLKDLKVAPKKPRAYKRKNKFPNQPNAVIKPIKLDGALNAFDLSNLIAGTDGSTLNLNPTPAPVAEIKEEPKLEANNDVDFTSIVSSLLNMAGNNKNVLSEPTNIINKNSNLLTTGCRFGKIFFRAKLPHSDLALKDPFPTHFFHNYPHQKRYLTFHRSQKLTQRLRQTRQTDPHFYRKYR